jgi:hypothetical protein
MYHLKMEKQMDNARSARMPTPTELFVGKKNSLQLSQLQVNNQVSNYLTRGKSTTPSGNKHPRHQLPLSHDNKKINLVQTVCTPDTS